MASIKTNRLMTGPRIIPRGDLVSYHVILGDPGAVSGDGEKSKTGDKKIQAKKSQEREEEPLGTMF